jgi:hypothetical protein
MLPHFFSKPHLEQQEFKNYFMSKFEPIVKLSTCLILPCLSVQSHFAYLSNIYITYLFP